MRKARPNKGILKGIEDRNSRDAMTQILDFLVANSKLDGFMHIDLTFDKAVTNHRVRHNLGAVPLDIIVTHFVGPGYLTWNYSRFDREFLDLNTSDECRIRAFVGRYGGT